MNWYLAKIVYQIISGDGSHTAQFDEQLRLIEAEDESTAFDKARTIGESGQEVFFNQQGALVSWRFINVAELSKITELVHGAELYSRVQEADNAELYIDFINKKAAHIQSNNSHKYLQLF